MRSVTRTSRALKALAVAAVAAAVPGMASAQPPAIGSTHTFLDPVFHGTVLCDTADQVRAIATAKQPSETYALYRMTTNDIDEPLCMAIAPTGRIIDVSPIGITVLSDSQYRAWVIEADVDGTTAFALYLEPIRYVGI